MSRCPCGLNAQCPYGVTASSSNPLNCPEWERHVRPSLLERVIGAIVAFFQRW